MHSFSSKAQIINQVDKDSTNYSLHFSEELTYIVKYAFFNLGEIIFNIAENSVINGIPVTKTIAYMDSYEGLPFVDLHQIYYSYIDSNYCPVEFLGLMLEEDTSYVKYTFEGDSLIKIKKGNYNSEEITFDSTALVKQKFQDGLSILFLARKHSGKDSTQHMPCFVNEKEETTIINFYAESEPVEIDQIDYEVDCVKIDGETDFVSVYGLTGQFEGWFSNDKDAVPILAKMNVIIGSVTLELIDWKKENWIPPKYIN
jgi:hypothetical protein